jgi:hypothetical protein
MINFLALALLALLPRPALSLADDVASILPRPEEERWLEVPWRTNLMDARVESQQTGKPIFLWIMVGNPQGCT